MKYRQMGSLDWEVSALGFGAMRLPQSRRLLVKTVDSKEAIETVRMGIDRGINYVDTAYPYHLGRSETILGEALRDGYRDKVKLVTKLPIWLVRKPEDFDTYLDRQLARLKTDVLDAYLLHAMNTSGLEKTRRLGLIEKLERAREAGKIKHIGFSFHDTLPVFKEIVDEHPWDIVMVQHNYMDTAIQATSEGIRYAHEKGMAVVVMEPVKGGMLANPPQSALNIMERATVKRSPVDWALQFLWNMPEVAVVLSGMSARQQVLENCDSADASGVGSLSPEELDVIDQLAAVFRQRVVVGCTACRYCMPCKEGVDIPDCFAILNNAALVDQGDFNQRMQTYLIRRRYRKKPHTEKQLEKNPESGAASLCTECKACIKKCPQGIDVPAELKKVHAVLAEGEDVRNYLPEGSSSEGAGTKASATRRFEGLRKLEGALLALAGLVHVGFVSLAVDRAAAPAALYWGAVGAGVVYIALGCLILARQLWALRPALVLNALGLAGVIVMLDQSPLRAVDPFLIALSCVSVPLLIYLNIKSGAHGRRSG